MSSDYHDWPVAKWGLLLAKNPQLLKLINAAIRAVPEDEKQELYRLWQPDRIDLAQVKIPFPGKEKSGSKTPSR
jgi:ABC-type amino acid transport substrate-binding protein